MSYVITLSFGYNVNSSIQIGDQVYMTGTSSLGGFNQNPSISPIHIGSVFAILSPTQFQVFGEYEDALGNPLPYNQPTGNEYISFSKNRVVNNSDLLGYYASVNFANDSTHEASLWSVGSIIAENSK